jgi:hypothetical protein
VSRLSRSALSRVMRAMSPEWCQCRVSVTICVSRQVHYKIGNNIDVYPKVSVILSAVKDPALELSMRRLRDPSLRSG